MNPARADSKNNPGRRPHHEPHNPGSTGHVHEVSKKETTKEHSSRGEEKDRSKGRTKRKNNPAPPVIGTVATINVIL